MIRAAVVSNEIKVFSFNHTNQKIATVLLKAKIVCLIYNSKIIFCLFLSSQIVVTIFLNYTLLVMCEYQNRKMG